MHDDLLARLEAHACLHDDLVMHDAEQAQWAADLRAANAEIERLRADVANLQEPVEDIAAWRLRFAGAVAAVEDEVRKRCATIVREAWAAYGCTCNDASDLGLKRKEVYVHDEDWPQVLALAEKLQRKRERAAKRVEG